MIQGSYNDDQWLWRLASDKEFQELFEYDFKYFRGITDSAWDSKLSLHDRLVYLFDDLGTVPDTLLPCALRFPNGRCPTFDSYKADKLLEWLKRRISEMILFDKVIGKCEQASAKGLLYGAKFEGSSFVYISTLYVTFSVTGMNGTPGKVSITCNCTAATDKMSANEILELECVAYPKTCHLQSFMDVRAKNLYAEVKNFIYKAYLVF